MSRYLFGEWILDRGAHDLMLRGDSIKLSPRAFEALGRLVESHPEAMTKQALYASIWRDTHVCTTNLNNVIAEIRRALGDRERKIVRTKHRYGYVFGLPVVRETAVRGSLPRFKLLIGGATTALADGEHLIGRSAEAAVFLDHPSISRRHAILRIDGGHAEVEDLRSKNGTYVENDLVDGVRTVHDRETLRFGSVCGIFCAASTGATTETDASPPI